MKRYIADKKVLEILERRVDLLPSFDLRKGFKVTDETFAFAFINKISIVLSDEEAGKIKQHGFYLAEEKKHQRTAQGYDYQKILSDVSIARKRKYNGTYKLNGSSFPLSFAAIDLGCNTIGTKGVDAVWVNPAGGYNFGSDTENFNETTANHGTPAFSQICSSIGYAPDAAGYALKVYDESEIITDSAILAALEWCFDFRDANDKKLCGVNMSLQFDDAGTDFEEAIAALIAADIMIFAAAGNLTTDSDCPKPACLPGVVAVTSYPENGLPYHKQVFAPDGENLHGTTCAMGGLGTEGIYANGSYGPCYGTSFACTEALGIFLLHVNMINRRRTMQETLDWMLSKASKTNFSNYFGSGYLKI